MRNQKRRVGTISNQAGSILVVNQDLAVLSPEKTILTYRLAGLGSRIAAHLIDLLTLLVVVFATFQLMLALGGVGAGALGFGLGMVVISAEPFLYFIVQESLWNGRTIGKFALGLRVRMADGTPVTPVAAIGRNLLRAADILPGTYFAGLLAMFTTPKSQRLGDLVANTVVVQERRPMPRFIPAPHVVGYHPFESQVGELRGMTPDEYVAMRKFCDRFPYLHPSVQERLVKEVYLPIAQRRAIPTPPNVHPIYLAEAAVMKFGREHGML